VIPSAANGRWEHSRAGSGSAGRFIKQHIGKAPVPDSSARTRPPFENAATKKQGALADALFGDRRN